MKRILLVLCTVITFTPAPTSAWPASRDLFCELAGADVEPVFVAEWGRRERLEAFHVFLATHHIEGHTLREWRAELCPEEKTVPLADVLRTAATKEE